LVALNPTEQIVLTAIELDRETQSRTVEIEHIWPGRMLSPEMMSIDLSVA